MLLDRLTLTEAAAYLCTFSESYKVPLTTIQYWVSAKRTNPHKKFSERTRNNTTLRILRSMAQEKLKYAILKIRRCVWCEWPSLFTHTHCTVSAVQYTCVKRSPSTRRCCSKTRSYSRLCNDAVADRRSSIEGDNCGRKQCGGHRAVHFGDAESMHVAILDGCYIGEVGIHFAQRNSGALTRSTFYKTILLCYVEERCCAY